MNPLLRTAALAGVAFVGCDSPSPFQPRGEGERVPIGVTIEDQARVDSASQYSFTGRANQPYLIFLESLEGRVQLSVYDSTHGFLIVSHSASAGGPWLEQNPSNTFGGAAEVVYRVSVWATPPATVARFRFKVHPIDTRPERVPASFSFGDTVIGETIDPMYDLDWFYVQGLAGQEIVTVVEPFEPAGSGSVGLSVIDDSAKQFVGYVFADAGADRLTTGRIRLAGTHDYLFAFGSVTSNTYPRYRGSYRFWTYVIDRAPEHRAATTPFNTEIRNERIDRAGDVDEFTFSAAANTDFNAFLQSSRAFQLELVPLMEGIYPVVSAPADTALFAHATGRFHIAQAGTYTIRLSGTEPSRVADTGSYRFYLYAIDRRPEHVPAAITPGDTVTGEGLELPGDVDEFTFTGAVGEEFNAFLQALGGSSATRLQLEVLSPSGTALLSTQSIGTDTSLLHQPTGRFALPSGGTYRLRVSGVPTYPADLNRGAYRLLLYRVSRQPETVPSTLAFGDSLSGEAIDLPGDIDEFYVSVPDSSGANLAFALENQSDGGVLRVQLVDSATGQVVGEGATSQASPRLSTGRMRLAPGKYAVRVTTSDYYLDRPVLRGPYRLWFYRFSFGPEVASDTIAIEDTVSEETIEPWGDADVFHFHGTRGQHVNVALQGLGYPAGTAFQAWIDGPPGAPVWAFASVTSPTYAAALHDHQTMRLDLPATGWYHITVSATGAAGSLADRGPYRLAVEHVGAAPELAGAALAPGDSVTTESIDAPGDWDEFTLTTTPGQEINVIFRGDPAMNGYAQIRVRDGASGDSLAGNVGQGTRIVGPFRVPASGQVTIAVYQDAGFVRFCYDATCGGLFALVGPYAFRVDPLNRGPENVLAAYAVGDTVQGDAVTPAGDIDEFTSSGTPGEVLTPFLRLAADPVPVEGLIMLEVVDPSTGANLAGGGWALFRETAEFLSPGNFTVPAGGTFIVRVKGYGSWGTGIATAPYEMLVKR